MRSSHGTDALVALEDDAPDILAATVPGTETLVWPQLRMYLARAVSETELGAGFVAAPGSARSVVVDIARSFLPSRDSVRRIRGRRAVLFATGSGRELVDGFARELGGDAVVVQDRPIRPSGPDRGPETRSFELDLARVTLGARLRRLPDASRESARGVVREIVARSGLPIEPDALARIEASMLYQLARLPHLEERFARLLDRVRPAMCVLEDASYGSRGTLIAMMKRRGIRVVEPQHGWIGPAHAAYNFGAFAAREPMAATLPDALLTFGEFWSAEIRYPGEVIAVGKPHLEAMTEGIAPLAARERELLVVSSVSDPEGMARFVLDLRDVLPEEWRLSFRPHPSERHLVAERYPALARDPRIAIDERSDLYEGLRAVRAVVGVASTALFEAAAFGVHVGVRESPFGELYVGDLFGERISTAAGIRAFVDRATGSDAPRLAVDLDALWRPGALATFRDLVSRWRVRPAP